MSGGPPSADSVTPRTTGLSILLGTSMPWSDGPFCYLLPSPLVPSFSLSAPPWAQHAPLWARVSTQAWRTSVRSPSSGLWNPLALGLWVSPRIQPRGGATCLAGLPPPPTPLWSQAQSPLSLVAHSSQQLLLGPRQRARLGASLAEADERKQVKSSALVLSRKKNL